MPYHCHVVNCDIVILTVLGNLSGVWFGNQNRNITTMVDSTCDTHALLSLSMTRYTSTVIW